MQFEKSILLTIFIFLVSSSVSIGLSQASFETKHERRRNLVDKAYKELVVFLDVGFHHGSISNRVYVYGAEDAYDIEYYTMNLYEARETIFDESFYSEKKIKCDPGTLGCYIKTCEKTFLYTKYFNNRFYSKNFDKECESGCGWAYLSLEEIRRIRALQDQGLFGCNIRLSLQEKNCTPNELNSFFNYEKSRLKVAHYVSITPLVFELGHLLLDEEGKTLWDENWNDSGEQDTWNLYYKWAYDLNEAIQFVLLHEYAHILGFRDQAAEDYAQSAIVHLRAAKRGFKLKDISYSKDFKEATDSENCADENFSLYLSHSSNISPPRNNRPESW